MQTRELVDRGPMMWPLGVAPGLSPTGDGGAVREFTVEREMDGWCRLGHFENCTYRLGTKQNACWGEHYTSAWKANSTPRHGTSVFRYRWPSQHVTDMFCLARLHFLEASPSSRLSTLLLSSWWWWEKSSCATQIPSLDHKCLVMIWWNPSTAI